MGCDTGVADTAPAESGCVLRDASVGVSSAARTLLEQVGEPGPDSLLFAPRKAFFGCPGGSFRDPDTTGWWKRIGGSCVWWAKARARGVVAAAAWSGAWTSGVQMMGVGDGGTGEGFKLLWISCVQCAMSRSCCTILWMISLSCRFSVPELW